MFYSNGFKFGHSYLFILDENNLIYVNGMQPIENIFEEIINKIEEYRNKNMNGIGSMMKHSIIQIIFILHLLLTVTLEKIIREMKEHRQIFAMKHGLKKS